MIVINSCITTHRGGIVDDESFHGLTIRRDLGLIHDNSLSYSQVKYAFMNTFIRQKRQERLNDGEK